MVQLISMIGSVAMIIALSASMADAGAVVAPAALVTATSSQYFIRNHNGLAAAYVAAPAPVVAPAPARLVVPAAPYVAAAAAPYIAAPAAPYVAATAPLLAAPAAPYVAAAEPYIAAPLVAIK